MVLGGGSICACGAGIFYGLYKLVGEAGAITVLIVLFLIGLLIITRLSIIDIARKISRRRLERRHQDADPDVLFKDNSAAAAGKTARNRRIQGPI